MTYDPDDWKPGDVAMLRAGDEWCRAMRTGVLSNLGWEVSRPDGKLWVSDAGVYDVRPLVVLDPESDEDARRLINSLGWPGPISIDVGCRALCSLVAKPKCPAVLNISGTHYSCVEPPEHTGPHGSPDAKAVWS